MNNWNRSVRGPVLLVPLDDGAVHLTVPRNANLGLDGCTHSGCGMVGWTHLGSRSRLRTPDGWPTTQLIESLVEIVDVAGILGSRSWVTATVAQLLLGGRGWRLPIGMNTEDVRETPGLSLNMEGLRFRDRRTAGSSGGACVLYISSR